MFDGVDTVGINSVVTLVDVSVSLTSAVLSVAVLFAIATPRIIDVVAAGAF